MDGKHKLAELQLAIMQVLWEKGDVTVAGVREALQPERKLAHTTIGTMLAKLEEKGHVSHQLVGRVNVYRAELRQEHVNQSMVSDLAERLFGGDISEMVCHLLDAQTVSKEDLSRMKKLIRDKEREIRNE